MNEKPYKIYNHIVFGRLYITQQNDFLYYKQLPNEVNWTSFKTLSYVPPKVSGYIKEMELIREMSEEELFLELL